MKVDEPGARVGGHESRLAPCSGALREAMGRGRAVNGLTVNGRRF